MLRFTVGVEQRKKSRLNRWIMIIEYKIKEE